MTGPILLRYTKDQFLVPAASIRVLRQRFARAEVHWHDFYEMVYVLHGTARHVINGVPLRLAPGSAFILTPADFHEISTDTGVPLTCYNVIIDPTALDPEIEDLVPRAEDEKPWQVDDFREAGADFARLWEETCHERRGTAVAISALVRCVLVAMARRRGDDNGDRMVRATAEAAIRHATFYIDHRFREPLTLTEVAAHAHLSPNYFSERFHEVTGTSFQSYLQQRRLRFARALLCATELGVTDVCYAAGFNDPSHFGRAYRRQYGHPPSAGRAVTVDSPGAGQRDGVVAHSRWRRRSRARGAG